MFGPLEQHGIEAPQGGSSGRDASRGAVGGLDPEVVLGVDPGLTRCGYAVLRRRSTQDVTIVAMGTIRTESADPLPHRLDELGREVRGLLLEHSPSAVAVEQVFFQTNVRTAMSVGQASGVVLALAAGFGCDVRQYSPSQVKSSVAGWGGADKDQVGRMVQQRFSLARVPRPADVADAVAVALCHCSLAPYVALRDRAIADAGGLA